MKQEFATTLTTWMDSANVSGRSLADMCDMSPSTVSQWRTGELEPTRRALAKMLPGIEEKYGATVAARLIIAHLHDEIPESMEKSISIHHTLGDRVLEYGDPRRDLMDWLDQQTSNNADFIHWLQYLRELMAGNSKEP